MALSKETTNNSGAVATYHRISSIEVDYSKKEAKVKVDSYLSKEMRDKEKSDAETAAKEQAEVEELNQLVANPTDDNEARRIELTELINSRGSATNTPVERKLSSIETSFSFDDADPDFSIADIYGWLKQTDEFTGAEDI